MSSFVLQQLLSESAEQRPRNIAVRFGQQQMSYVELDRMSDRIASALRASGVCKGDRVGILLNKSVASILSVFGILKSGAAYVPLDPGAPATRSGFVMQDCGTRVLLTSGKQVAKAVEMAAAGAPLELAIVMEDEQALPEHALPFATRSLADILLDPGGPGPDWSGSESDLAYILYTSGSTGQPKGVMISHRNALTFVDWAAREFNVGPDDVLSNHAPLHFDLSIFDIFVSAKVGATVAPVPEGLSVFPIRLAQWISQNRITVWYSVPSLLSMLVTYGSLDRWDLAALRTILFAGEVFPVKYLRRLMECLPEPAYFNLYGPTETNVITSYQVGPLDSNRTEPIPIGRACANMGVFALDDDGQLMSETGREGELYGRGPSVALGYWGRPDRTAELFVQNPLQSRYVDRAYRTGDLVSLDEAGNYRYHGRRDHMLKSRGYRIELGEIESALYSHPSIREAAVVPVPDELVGHRLAAFVVLNGAELGADTIQQHCRDRLPTYMVPEHLLLRTSLPKTSNGKIDRVTLAAAAIREAAATSASNNPPAVLKEGRTRGN